ncbi:MAG: GAF domain-containing protein [Fimbriimonadaceae bacterium]|jgi:two-component sensor histidine kinase|nr:GAF domain-containing protein [Fimbriimonadaceae bacterium]
MSILLDLIADAPTEEQALIEAAQHIRDAVGVDACDILIAQAGTLAIRASTETTAPNSMIRIGKGIGLVGTAYSRAKRVMVKSGLAKHRLHRVVPGLNERDFESALAHPMVLSNGVVGIVYLRRLSEWHPNRSEYTLVHSLSQELAHAWRVYKSAFSHGSQSNRLGALSQVSKTLTASPYLEEILQLLVNMTASRFNYRVVTVRLLDEKRKELILRATQAVNRAYQRKRALKLGESIAGRVIKTKTAVIIQDVQSDPEYIGHDLAIEQGLRSMICVPLTIQERAVGVLTCYTGEIREFSGDEIQALETLARQAAVNIEHAKLQVRNTLMQEMHHRVKNNLQQVASLLRLQLRQSHYKTLEQALTDSLSRILAIAAVHDLLSREDLDHVSLRAIADTLVHHQQQSFLMPGKRIAFQVEGDHVYLNTNQATQVALILNEMIQNAVEHGFAHKDEGSIHVTVEERHGEIGVWTSNDGDPLPEGFDYTKGGQLGLQIIRSLAGSLGGSFKMEDRLSWTVCEVAFTRQGAE